MTKIAILQLRPVLGGINAHLLPEPMQIGKIM
jgi:hypothetical protein